MLKQTFMAVLAILLIVGCEDTNDVTQAETFSFVSSNVKTGPAVFYSFASNSGDSLDNGNWDLKFATFSFTIPINDSTMMTISNPYFAGSETAGIARVDAASLDDVTEIPASFSDSVYTTIEEEDNWYTMTDAHIVQPLDYVYVVNTADGKYPAFEITSYYDAEGNSGVYTIAWKYLAD